MKCFKCTEHFEVEEHIEEKIALVGEEYSRMYCDTCKVCYVCYRNTEKGMTRCMLCGYHYHNWHKEESRERKSVCAKCVFVEKEATHAALVGPEIPVLERSVEEISGDLTRKIAEIVKKAQTSSKYTEGIKEVVLENVKMVPLFSSPYPEEYTRHSALYICGGCFEYFPTEFVLGRHKRKCTHVLPPGRLLYLDTEGMGVFEVEGSKQKTYCQSLCLLAKMFLNHKTLYYDVEPFLFYIVGEVHENRFTMQGYFSKEKEEGSNNLSCIVVLPPYRRLGLGSFLIDFSYYLTRTSSEPPYQAGPEQPLSEDGERAYMAYWKDSVVRCVLFKRYFACNDEGFKTISQTTGISEDSIRKAYKELSAVYGKSPLFPDFLTGREKVKKTRRLKKSGLVTEKPVPRKAPEENTSSAAESFLHEDKVY
ncbi:histone acetyltransferase MYST2 [Nematocida sp. AWRm77]|nr:histone acetyltransferase MYST2 [Nematocida sp. AWRm77]